MFIRGRQGHLALKLKLRTQLERRSISEMGDASRHAVSRGNGIHENRCACAVGSLIIPIALGIVFLTALDVDHGILVKVEAVQSIGKQVAGHGIQLGFGIDVDVVLIREHGGIGHADDLHIVGVNDIVGHVVFGIHAIEIQRILTRHQRDEFRGVVVNS